MYETLTLALILIPCLVIAIVFHEVAHGYVALLLGDPTAQEQRRLSLNPIRHVDPVGTILVPGALALFGGPIFGWAKPVPVDARRLDNPRFGMMAVAAAGPGTNVLLALGAAIVFGVAAGLATNWGVGLPSWGMDAFYSFVLINVFLALFNMLPIPPFDGSHIVGGLLPRRWSRQWQKLQAMGMLLLLVLIAATWAFPNARWVEQVIFPPVQWLTSQFYSVFMATQALIA